MEESSGASTDSRSKLKMPCEECKLNPSKYKCPACYLVTCSLPCVKAHKQRTACTGKRDKTAFVPLSQFNDSILHSDYHMLEDVKRATDTARRVRTKLCNGDGSRRHLFYRNLIKAARSRQTELLLLPRGMSRRNENRSYYNHRLNRIEWTIEWRFHSTDVIRIDHGVDENATLRSVVEKHLQPTPWRHNLSKFCEVPIHVLKFLIRKFAKGSKSSLRELDIDAPISQQFQDLVILEYPMIQVYLPSETAFDSEVVKYRPGITETTVQSCDTPTTKGEATTTIKEIDDDETLNNNTRALKELAFGSDQGLLDLYPHLVCKGYDLEEGEIYDLEEGEIYELEEGEIRYELEEGEMTP